MKKKQLILLSLLAALPFSVASCHKEQPQESFHVIKSGIRIPLRIC